MNAHEALDGIARTIQSQGPDTPNRHYGRNQYHWLMECCDTLAKALADVPLPADLLPLLAQAAEQPIEKMDDVETLATAWLTAEDITARLRARLIEERYWWSSVT